MRVNGRAKSQKVLAKLWSGGRKVQIIINNKLVDLSHLNSITRTMTLDLSRGNTQKKDARLEFRFSSHCYSREPKTVEVIPSNMLVRDGSPHCPRNRIFSQERYDLSLGLVVLIDDLIKNNGNVEKTRHRNFFSTNLVASNMNGILQTVSYYVFMKAKKVKDENQPPRLDIFVESAYPSNQHIPSPIPKGNPTPLSEVLGEVWVG